MEILNRINYLEKPGRLKRTTSPRFNYMKEYHVKNQDRKDKYIEEYRIKNKDKIAIQVKGYRLKKRYGMTIEQYDSLLKEQNNRCAICNRHQSELQKPLAVDHNHKSGKVRGLLCTSCNLMLGYVCDSVNVLDKAKEYLCKYCALE